MFCWSLWRKGHFYEAGGKQLNRLGRTHRWLLYISSAFLIVTGVIWTFIRYAPVAGINVDPEAVAISAWVLRIHGGAAVAVSILLGTLLNAHVPKGWNSARSKISGVGTLGITAFLIVTGYLLYYQGGEFSRLMTSYGHILAGLLLPIFILAHVQRRQSAPQDECE